MSNNQPSSDTHDGKENKDRPQQRAQRWRAAAGLKDKGSFFTPRKSASGKSDGIPPTQGSQAEAGTTALARGQTVGKSSSEDIGGHASPERTGNQTASGALHGLKRGHIQESRNLETPQRHGNAGQELVHASRASISASSQKAMQPSTPRCRTPASAQQPSTASKLWTILKTGAKLGFASKPANTGTFFQYRQLQYGHDVISARKMLLSSFPSDHCAAKRRLFSATCQGCFHD